MSYAFFKSMKQTLVSRLLLLRENNSSFKINYCSKASVLRVNPAYSGMIFYVAYKRSWMRLFNIYANTLYVLFNKAMPR